MIPPGRRGLQLKRFQPFWVQVIDIHPTIFLFANDKLPDGIILPQAAIAPSLNMSRPLAKTIIPLEKEHPELKFMRVCFANSSYAFRTQEWANLARDHG
jgi:hypothetical protein